MPQGDINKNAEFLTQKCLQRSLKVKFALALYQNLNVTRSTICVESFTLVSKSAQKAPFLAFAALLIASLRISNQLMKNKLHFI